MKVQRPSAAAIECATANMDVDSGPTALDTFPLMARAYNVRKTIEEAIGPDKMQPRPQPKKVSAAGQEGKDTGRQRNKGALKTSDLDVSSHKYWDIYDQSVRLYAEYRSKKDAQQAAAPKAPPSRRRMHQSQSAPTLARPKDSGAWREQMDVMPDALMQRHASATAMFGNPLQPTRPISHTEFRSCSAHAYKKGSDCHTLWSGNVDYRGPGPIVRPRQTAPYQQRQIPHVNHRLCSHTYMHDKWAPCPREQASSRTAVMVRMQAYQTMRECTYTNGPRTLW